MVSKAPQEHHPKSVCINLRVQSCLKLRADFRLTEEEAGELMPSVLWVPVAQAACEGSDALVVQICSINLLCAGS